MRWWPWRRRPQPDPADLDERTRQGEHAAQEAREIAARAEPGLRALERRKPRNGVFEEVLYTLEPHRRGAR